MSTYPMFNAAGLPGFTAGGSPIFGAAASCCYYQLYTCPTPGTSVNKWVSAATYSPGDVVSDDSGTTWYHIPVGAVASLCPGTIVSVTAGTTEDCGGVDCCEVGECSFAPTSTIAEQTITVTGTHYDSATDCTGSVDDTFEIEYAITANVDFFCDQFTLSSVNYVYAQWNVTGNITSDIGLSATGASIHIAYIVSGSFIWLLIWHGSDTITDAFQGLAAVIAPKVPIASGCLGADLSECDPDVGAGASWHYGVTGLRIENNDDCDPPAP
jgi:hypothetical protein